MQNFQYPARFEPVYVEPAAPATVYLDWLPVGEYAFEPEYAVSAESFVVEPSILATAPMDWLYQTEEFQPPPPPHVDIGFPANPSDFPVVVVPDIPLNVDSAIILDRYDDVGPAGFMVADPTTFLLSPDSLLKFPVTANLKYKFRFVCWVYMTGAGDFSYDISGPSPAFLRYVTQRVDQGGSTLSATIVRTVFGTLDVLTGGAGGEAMVEIVGYIQPTASGYVSLRWQKNPGTTVRQGSLVEYRQVT
ncbi:MAG: hypothetical protein AB7I42_24280 [Bradyrhizobium sp.]|uniref:hypothetical protein n=1 Tax=Bradyrhizobium sp. TaxID=376 RepID=UPI003D0E50E8